MYQVEDNLNKLGIRIRNFAIGNHKTKCPECQPHAHNPKDNPLSVTVESDHAIYNCHHCGFSGGVGDGSIKPSYKPTTPVYKKPEPVKSEPMDKAYAWFKTRGIGKPTIDAMKISYENNQIAFQYFDSSGDLTNIKYRGANKTFRQTAETKPILYNYDNCYNSDTVIFVEGEMDVLACCEVGYTFATSLPGGAPKEAKFKADDARFKALGNCPLKAKKIILFTDTDGPGKALHQELLHRFGKDICWYVKAPDDCKDANEVLMKHGKEKLIACLENAVPYPIDGLYTVRDYYNEVHNLYDGNYQKPIEIGMKGLDELYKIIAPRFDVWTGIPNHGKSLMLDQVMLNLAQNHGWKFAIFSPEHSTAMHIRRMVQMHLGLSLDEGFTNRMDKKQLNDGLAFINKHFFFIETKDAVPSIDLILKVAKSSILKHGVKGIVIDPFNEVSAKREGNQREDEHIRDFISLCKRFSRVHNILFWVVAHPTKMQKGNDGRYQQVSAYDISGASHWANQSDCVISVYRDFDDNSTTVITRKIREQDMYGKIGEAKFFYDLGKRRFMPQEDSYYDYDI